MRTSQISLLSALGVVLVGIIALVGAVRLTLSGFVDDASAEERESATLSPDLTGFDRILVKGSWVVEVTQGDEWAVELSYPENRGDDLRVGVNGDQLVLDVQGGGGPSWRWWGRSPEPFHADITMPSLEGLDIDGSGNVTLEDFEGELLAVSIAGFANVEGHGGHYDELDLDVGGAANVELDIPVTDAEVDLSGAGNVEVNMDGGVLSGSLSGFGNIEYSGTVSDENVNVTGFGHVNRK